MKSSSLKNVTKAPLRKLAPKQDDAIMTARINRHGKLVMAQHGVPAIAAEIMGRYGSKVLSGPFAGMDYIPQPTGSSFLPKLVGSYESEIHK